MSGIIPARAGFTCSCKYGRAAIRDHPRSRGVYGPVVRAYTLTQGSSPLARGLPFILAGIEDRDRIIPARAGFTPSRR